MGDRRASDERLPWLSPHAPDPSPPAARPTSPARRTLLVLLMLFMASAIGLIAFLVGRTTAPGSGEPSRSAPLTMRLPAPTPARPAPPLAQPTPAPTTVAPAAEQGKPSSRHGPRASAVRTTEPARPRRRAPTDRRGMIPPITRAFPRAAPAVAASRQRPVTAARRAASGPAGVVQLGAYVTLPLLDASWGRLVTAFPPLATLPRAVTVTGPTPGRPRFYRLRVLLGSPREARALCDRLHGLGRGCMVVRNAK